jgi:hypothetical protein
MRFDALAGCSALVKGTPELDDKSHALLFFLLIHVAAHWIQCRLSFDKANATTDA